MPPDVFPERMWKKAIETQAAAIRKLDFVSDLDVHFDLDNPFPVPGLNPDVKVQNMSAKDLPDKHRIWDTSGALWKRERTGYGLIQFIINQAGFTYIDNRANVEDLRIAPRFLIRIFVPRDYPAQGVGYAFTFSDEGDFEYPHYPNIMRRSENPQHGYWSNVGLFGGVSMVVHFPEGAMCLNALNEKGTRLSDIVIRVKNYLGVPLGIWEVDGSIKNDRGFDHELYEYYKIHAKALNKAITRYSESKPSRSIPTNRSGKLPPPPPPPPLPPKKGGGQSRGTKRAKTSGGLPPPPPPPPPRT